jgi:hypothetical protein
LGRGEELLDAKVTRVEEGARGIVLMKDRNDRKKIGVAGKYKQITLRKVRSYTERDCDKFVCAFKIAKTKWEEKEGKKSSNESSKKKNVDAIDNLYQRSFVW